MTHNPPNGVRRRILFVAMHRPGRSPGQRFRFEQYLPALERAGWEWDLSTFVSETDDRAIYRPGKYGRKAYVVAKSIAVRLRDLWVAQRYDVVFVYREALALNTSIVERVLARLGPGVVLDYDDAIWIPQVTTGGRLVQRLRSGDKFADVVSSADAVIAGNEYLADYARPMNGNVHVIPTVLDTGHYTPASGPSRTDGPVRIGWSGSPSTVPYFESITPALVEVRHRFGSGVEFSLLGDASYEHEALGIRGMSWTEDRELGYVQGLDVGVMPQPDDQWTRGKCGFKALLYMATGGAAVVSPVGVNAEIVDHGRNGLWASSHDEWVSMLSRLVTDPVYRRKLGEAGRATVTERYSVEAYKDTFVGVLEAVAVSPRSP